VDGDGGLPRKVRIGFFCNGLEIDEETVGQLECEIDVDRDGFVVRDLNADDVLVFLQTGEAEFSIVRGEIRNNELVLNVQHTDGDAFCRMVVVCEQNLAANIDGVLSRNMGREKKTGKDQEDWSEVEHSDLQGGEYNTTLRKSGRELSPGGEAGRGASFARSALDEADLN